jgi:NAD(P)H-nitrite reductase large subunit
MGMRLFSIGDVGGNPANAYSIERKGDSDNFEKYFYVDDHLVGGILIGNISKSGRLKKGVAENLSKSEFEND